MTDQEKHDQEHFQTRIIHWAYRKLIELVGEGEAEAFLFSLAEGEDAVSLAIKAEENQCDTCDLDLTKEKDDGGCTCAPEDHSTYF